MEYSLTPLPLKKRVLAPKIDKNVLTLEEFKQKSFVELVSYFNTYDKIKMFCNSLVKSTQDELIILIKNEDVLENSEESFEKHKALLLSYMRLPITTKSKDPHIIERYSKFVMNKPKRLNISFIIYRRKLIELGLLKESINDKYAKTTKKSKSPKERTLHRTIATN
jgi:hypothetical protein